MLLDPKDVPQEARRKLLAVLGGRVKTFDLGVSKSYLYKLRIGLKPVPAYVDYNRVRSYDVDRLVRLVRA